MTTLAAIYLSHPTWVWMGIGAILLAVEVMTGSGWLLWPAGQAGIWASGRMTGRRSVHLSIWPSVRLTAWPPSRPRASYSANAASAGPATRQMRHSGITVAPIFL